MADISCASRRLPHPPLVIAVIFCLLMQPSAACAEPAEPAGIRTQVSSSHCLISSTDVPPVAVPRAPSPAVSDLTDRIVGKEIELMRLNTNYRINSTKVSKLRPWRIWLYNEAHFAVNNAGITTLAYARWKYWQRPALLPPHLAKAGPTLLLIGHSILAGGLVLETCLDAIRDRHLKKMGFDERTATHRVMQLNREIGEMLSSRKSIIDANSSLSERERQTLNAEGAVLSDLKDASVLEYSRFNIRAARFIAGRNTNQLTALAGATTGGYLGSLMSLEAAACHRPHYAGAAGVGFTLSGACIVLNPLLTRLGMIAAGKFASHRLDKQLQGVNATAMDSLKANQEALSALLGSSSAGGDVLDTISRRSQIYAAQKDLLERQTAVARNEAREQNHDLVEKLLVNSAIGGTKMAYGIQLANAGFGFHANPNLPAVKVKIAIGRQVRTVTLPKPKGGTNLFSKRLAQGATTFIPGTGIGILDAAQARARGQAQWFRQRGAGPEANKFLKLRLASLDKMDEMLKSGAAQPLH